MELSIIITAFNNWKLTAQCLASIFKSSYPKENYEIIFVNNASTDKTDTFITYLVESNEPIKYIKLDKNENFLKGTNIGWQKVETPFVMLLNNDVFVTPDCISEMMDIIKSDKSIGVVGAFEFLLNGGWSKEKPFIFWGKKNLLDTELKDYNDLKIDHLVRSVDVDIVGSACCIIRQNIIDKIGYFDERFAPCMVEQEDLWMRIKQYTNYRIVLAPFARMFHHVGATTSFDTNYYQKVIKENKKKFLKKWKSLIKEE